MLTIHDNLSIDLSRPVAEIIGNHGAAAARPAVREDRARPDAAYGELRPELLPRK
ncbi:hypothetical protein HC891_13690 [Candidatus Gracilibacteria bacterium]|nr:hypothetical protein [Candidatus Gracilibacteria bacterium]